jgi:hypothetical protein
MNLAEDGGFELPPADIDFGTENYTAMNFRASGDWLRVPPFLHVSEFVDFTAREGHIV